MLTSLFNAGERSKRQLVKYDEIPKVMVEAVTSIEDRRFFQHSGVNFMRLAEAAWIDFTHQRHQQGGSTITMQLSRGVLSYSAEDLQTQADRNAHRSGARAEI